MTAQPDISAGPASDKLDRGVLKVAGVVVLGVVMSIVDVTVVNVALQALSQAFKTSLDTIQWVATGYMLALATVIPVTGWACQRFGTKRLYMLSIFMFLVGSVLAGMAWNIESLILFRVIQGLGGGMLMPAGMTIMTQAAGPARVGRVMAVLGVPMLLGPIGGPILGGWLVDSFSWHWIFFINVPIGIVALVLAWRVLPKDNPEGAKKFDFPGMLMLSPGVALLIYGVSNVPSAGGFSHTKVWLPMLAGVVLIAGFVFRALRFENPLIDLRLLKNKVFASSVITMTFFAVAFFGAMLLFPLYFILVREQSALHAGLLLAPQGLGAMVTMPIAGRLADKAGVRKLVLPGLGLIIVGMAIFTQIEADTNYWQIMGTLFLMGLGMGFTMMPIMTAALQTLTHKDVPNASTTLNIVQQTAGAIGSAIMSVILAGLLATRFGVPTEQGQLVATVAIRDPRFPTHAQAPTLATDAFAHTFTWAAILIALCLIPAMMLPWRKPAPAPSTDGDATEAPPVMLTH
ncbi:DHA2 family efflux MFS transporter permease subunit [Labedaea rhizosphaerae]|uniref:DHA2 family efflux MFS transporter permease subunit n=1 Tax=Labedaea rhizosphaerae TaxID=598644 RepID=UPI00105CAEAC|nr:DHA2 family efflux MFS transporter permease subunit [Labedaea rhizosphaerae]